MEMTLIWTVLALACLVSAVLVEAARLIFRWPWLDDARNLLLLAGFVLALIAATSL